LHAGGGSRDRALGDQLLGTGERAGVSCVLDVAALEIEAAGVEAERDDAEESRRRRATITRL